MSSTLKLADPEFLADPVPRLLGLAEQGPVVRAEHIDGQPVWLVTRNEEVRTVLRDPRFANDSTSVPGNEHNDRAQMLAAVGLPEEHIGYLTRSVLDADPPDHTRLRKLVSRAFTVRRVNELRPRVEEITAELLDAMQRLPQPVDLLQHFAYPLPITVISELVGVPASERAQWKTWSDQLTRIGDIPGMTAALREIVVHIQQMLAERRSTPRDDLTTAMVQVRDTDGDRLNETELVTMVLTLVFAGYETTANLIGNGTAALLRNPDQLALLRRDPAQLPAAVHELMRHSGPVHMARPRYATEDLTLAGTEIPAGAMVQPVLLGANHDPHHFTEPDALSITRRPADKPGEDHVGFGVGAHYCLGAALARMEAEAAFGRLLERFPELALAEAELEWQPGVPTLRRLRSLPVRLNGGAG